MTERESIFEEELNLIQNEIIRNWTKGALNQIPVYFFWVAASSTGKYHPGFASGEGGLVRHTKVAVWFAKTMLELEQNQNVFSPDERDRIISALILHDGFKHGVHQELFTRADHPIICADFLRHLPDETGLCRSIPNLVESHMGQWNTDYRTRMKILPTPQTEAEKFVHLCDYLASRKPISLEIETYTVPQAEQFHAKEKEKAKQILFELVAVAKDKISKGVDREKLYDAIEKSCGIRNPNKIECCSDAMLALESVKEVN